MSRAWDPYVRQDDLSVDQFRSALHNFALSQVGELLMRCCGVSIDQIVRQPSPSGREVMVAAASAEGAETAISLVIDVYSDAMPDDVDLAGVRLQHQRSFLLPTHFAFVIRDGYTILADEALVRLLKTDRARSHGIDLRPIDRGAPERPVGDLVSDQGR